MRTFGGFAGALALGLTIDAAVASAQEAPPYNPAIDVQLFQYAIGPKSFFTVADADVGAKQQLSMDFLVTFLSNPFKIYDCVDAECSMTTERLKVVESMVAGQLSGAYGLTDSVQLGASLPIIFTMSGDGLEPGTAMPVAGGLQLSGLGDLLVEAKKRIVTKPSLRLAAALGVTLPSSFGSGGSTFIGDDLPAFRGHLDAQWRAAGGRLTVGLNGGVILRKPREIYASEIGHQLIYGAAAAVRVTERLSLIGESFGRTGLLSQSQDDSPIEVIGGLRVQAGRSLAVVAGGGAGVMPGIGSPDARFFVSLGWAPDVRDSDGDGVANNRDGCVLVPEDKDGFADGDGCPEDDNDGDRRLDGDDQCPDEGEDLDGVDDDDGCPDLDNDGDKIPDLQDKCTMDAEDGKAPSPQDGCPLNKADTDFDGVMDDVDACADAEEDMDGFEDEDGCPEVDNDADGVADDADKCPVCIEDRDGTDDEDGCPDLDNDLDGLADAADKCPDEVETINGINDLDGCPDDGAETIVLDGDVIQLPRAPSFDRRGLTKAGAVVVDQLALVMLRARDVTSWLVAIGAAKEADALRLAEWIRSRLLERGVAEEGLQIIGAAGPARVGAIVQERADPDAEPAPLVCPQSATAQPRGSAATVPAVVATAPTPPATTDEELIIEDEPVAFVDPATVTDTDGDGLMDAADRCPAAAGPAPAEGCPGADADADGIVDAADNCPAEAGTAANRGCAAPQLVTIIGGKIDLLDSVYFKTGKATIEARSFPLLDNVVAVLLAHPDWKVRIEGHTDNAGKARANKKLSAARAKAVLAYLTKKKVPKKRLTSVGFGPDQPIADNATPEGREKNRRVVFAVVGG